jgi:pSer/pThr/pTyr-binding forkhead associated (FHA) protein
MLKIQFKDRRKPAMWLLDSTLKLGSDQSCDIIIDEDLVESLHCELLIDQENITLTNLSTNKSIFVNDIPVLKTHQLVAWDVIKVGTSELEIIDPLQERNRSSQVQASKTIIRPAVSEWMLKANTAPLIGQFFQINHAFTLGRDEKADIVIPLSYISRIHARLIIKKTKLIVEDAGSSNGSFVNDEKIKSCELRNNDIIRLDEFSFTVIGPEEKERNKPRTIVREQKEIIDKIKKKISSKMNKQEFSGNVVFLHDMDKKSQGKVYEIAQAENHLSKMLGHHLSTSEKSVSARHVYLNETQLGWEVINNGASDGLLINGDMQIRAVLQNEDQITVGGRVLKFQSTGDIPTNYFMPKKKKTSVMKYLLVVMLIGSVLGISFYLNWFDLV